MQHIFKKTMLVATVSLLTAPSAYATNGYAAHGYGTVQKAMGGTAVAGSDNAMNMATNPASMSFGENNFTVGLEVFSPDRGFSHNGRPDVDGPGPDQGIPGASFKGNDDDYFPIPEFGYQKKLSNKFSVGIVAYGNGGMNATYDSPILGPRNNPDGSPINLDGSAVGPNTGIDFAQLLVAPGVSMKLNKDHAVGLSLNLAYQRIKVNGVAAFSSLSRDPSSLSSRGYASSTGAGMTLGWQGRLSSRLKAGLAYRSVTKMSKFDKYKGLLAEQGDFDIPSMITAGVSFQATPKTTLAFDYARINYSDVASISNKNNTAELQGQLLQGTPPQDLVGPKAGDDDGAGFGWEDQDVFKIGIKHQLNSKFAILAGYNHGDAPIGSDQTAFNILAPATVEDHLTLGLDWKLTKKSNLSFQYMHAFNNKITGDSSFVNAGTAQQAPANPGAFIPIGANPATDGSAANLEMDQNTFGVSYSVNF